MSYTDAVWIRDGFCLHLHWNGSNLDFRAHLRKVHEPGTASNDP